MNVHRTGALFGSADRTLEGLSAEYPAFRFSFEFFGRHGWCYVAARIDGSAPGACMLVTGDLAEMRRELASQSVSAPPATGER